MRDNFESRGQQMFFGLSVVMTEQCGHLYCTLCCKNFACRTSSIKRHFETKHEKLLKMIRRRIKLLKRQFLVTKNRVACRSQYKSKYGKCSSYKVTECIAKRGKLCLPH